MKTHAAYAVFVLSLASTTVCKLGHPGGPMKLHRDSPDGFETMKQFPYSVSISDSDNDTIFECMTSKRLAIDEETMTGTFEFLLPSLGRTLLYYVREGDSPGTMIFTSSTDPIPRDGIIYYTDYQNCVVADLELEGDGHQCTLWARAEVEKNMPENCIDQFVDVCGVIVPADSRDLCANVGSNM
ncbi:hypothetical protein MTO96_032394 [Rhipicephalus appendiculatus]